MPMTTYTDQKVLNAVLQAASLSAPATWYVGLLQCTGPWQPSVAYTTTQYVVPTNFSSLTPGTPGRIFVCTTGGTSSSSTQPTWPTMVGGTVGDGSGSLVWTEVTLLFTAGTFTSAELSGNNYARVSVTANSTNFANATSARPAVTYNGTAINFASPSAQWNATCALILADASSSGNIWWWSDLSQLVQAPSSSSPSVAIDGMAWSLT